MREYRVDITEILESTVYVDANDEDEAYELALKELNDGFCAPYHTSCEVRDFEVTPNGDEWDDDEPDECDEED